MIWVIVVIFEAVGIERAFAFGTSIFLVVRWSLSCEDMGDERSGRGSWPGTKEVWLNACADCCVSQVVLYVQELLVCLLLFIV